MSGVVEVHEDLDEEDLEELVVQVELLREENARLRNEYARAKRAGHRRAAIGLAGVGAIAGIGGVVFPAQRDILFAIAATGFFAAVLSAYLTPERFVAASVGERVYTAMSESLRELVGTLGLTEERVYVPMGSEVRLFIPAREAYELPEAADLGEILVVPERPAGRGISIHPTGAALLGELSELHTAASVHEQTDVLSEALVETFELVDEVRPEVDPSGGNATFAVTGSVYGSVDRLDHPVASFLACGLAVATDQPVTLSVVPGDERVDHLLSCSWEPEEAR